MHPGQQRAPGAAGRQDTLSLCKYPPLVGHRGQTLYSDNDFVRRRVPDPCSASYRNGHGPTRSHRDLDPDRLRVPSAPLDRNAAAIHSGCCSGYASNPGKLAPASGALWILAQSSRRSPEEFFDNRCENNRVLFGTGRIHRGRACAALRSRRWLASVHEVCPCRDKSGKVVRMDEPDISVVLQAVPVLWRSILQIRRDDEDWRPTIPLLSPDRSRPDRDIPDIAWLVRPGLLVGRVIVNGSEDSRDHREPLLRVFRALLPRGVTQISVEPLKPEPGQESIHFGDDEG
jgi:hypothetical protein